MNYALKHHHLAVIKMLVEECGCSLEMRTPVRLQKLRQNHFVWHCAYSVVVVSGISFSTFWSL